MKNHSKRIISINVIILPGNTFHVVHVVHGSILLLRVNVGIMYRTIFLGVQKKYSFHGGSKKSCPLFGVIE